MDDRDKKLAEAALSVFAKYGVGKSTMNDIARAAGVARQTLYNAYPSKEAVLRAAVRYAADQTLYAVEAAWLDQTTLAEKLETFFQLGPLHWYDIIDASPEAADLIDGIHTIANDELNEIGKVWTGRLEVVLRAHAKEGTSADSNAASTADFIYSASSSAKLNAANRGVLETRLDILKLAILAFVESSDDGQASSV